MYEKYFEKLTEECEIRNRSSNTARTYSDNIKRFLIDVGKHPDQLLPDDAGQYILKKHREGISAEYCNFVQSVKIRLQGQRKIVNLCGYTFWTYLVRHLLAPYKEIPIHIAHKKKYGQL